MRTSLIICCILYCGQWAAAPLREPVQDASPSKQIDPRVRSILQEALGLSQNSGGSALGREQGLLIGKVQIRARDFDGARKSFLGSSYPYGRDSGLLHLACALARDGRKQRALEILAERGKEWRDEDYAANLVDLQFFEYLIVSGKLDVAAEAIDRAKNDWFRTEKLRKLALAYAKLGDTAKATGFFSKAVDAGVRQTEDYARAEALWEAANAQLAAGYVDSAKATLWLATDKQQYKDAWAKVSAYMECATLAAKMKDLQTARRLFQRALTAQKSVNAMNKTNALDQISVAQANAGLFDDALQTASLVKHSEKDFTQDGNREHALFAIAVAKNEQGDTAGAVNTPLSIKYFTQYRDDALQQIVAAFVATRDLKAALAATPKFHNPSLRAAATLRVATAYARSSKENIAADIAAHVAAGVHLTVKDDFGAPFGLKRFDYRLPQTWSVDYDYIGVSSNGIIAQSNRDRSALTAAAMELFQALHLKPAKSFGVLFNDIAEGHIVRSLARAHAAAGNVDEALKWAREIGASKVAKANDYQAQWAVDRRVGALIGVAEGMLDRAGIPEEKPDRRLPQW